MLKKMLDFVGTKRWFCWSFGEDMEQKRPKRVPSWFQTVFAVVTPYGERQGHFFACNRCYKCCVCMSYQHDLILFTLIHI